MDQNVQHTESSKPLISVLVLTYQHADFIRQCLDGVLMQQTDFPLELLIGDDGSHDGTTEICQEYQQRYPDIVKLFVYNRQEPERQAYTGGPGRYNFLTTLQQVRGDFLALCEGDDYWTDPAKLQIQTQFLLGNPEYSACFHTVKIDTPVGLTADWMTHVEDDTVTLEILAKTNCIHTPTIMYRNPRQWRLPEFTKTTPVLDYVLHCLTAAIGPIKLINREMAVYRVHENSYWSSSPPEWRLCRWLQVVYPLIHYFEAHLTAHSIFIEQFGTIAEKVFKLESTKQEDAGLILEQLFELDKARVLDLCTGKRVSMAPADALLEQVNHATTLLKSSVPAAVLKLAEELDDPEQVETLFVKMADALVKKRHSLSAIDYRQDLLKTYMAIQKFYATRKQSAIIVKVKEELYKQLIHNDYQLWIEKHSLREVDAEILAERMILHWRLRPVLHCFMFVLPGETELLADTIDTLAAQLYDNWQLTVISVLPCPDPIFEQTHCLHWRTLMEHDDPYTVLNLEIEQYPQHWISFIEPGLQYSTHSLAKIADYINLFPQASFIYTDDDLVDANGLRFEPRFKPDFNLDLLRSSPYIGKGWMPAERLLIAGGIRDLPGAENYDLALRWFELFGETAFCHITDVLTHKSAVVDRPFDSRAGEVALKQHFERLALPVNIYPGYVDNSYRVEYCHSTSPRVSIIIPTKDKLEFLQPCVESLLDKTTYQNYEVLIVDNQSQDSDTFAYYQQLTAVYADNVRVLHYDQPFNFSAINNWAAAQAQGDYLILLNNDTEIIQPEWIERLLNHGQRHDVAVVGARLLYPETGRLQHAGIVIGMGLTADHPYNNMLDVSDYTPMERARLDQNFPAVTAAMMMVRRDIYEQMGGLDEDNFAVLFNDVDFCLRVVEAGYRIVWTPFAMGVHHGNSSLKLSNSEELYTDWFGIAEKQQQTCKERRQFMLRWKDKVAHDPSYNTNLSLTTGLPLPDVNAPLNWELHHHLRLRVFGVPLNGGSGDYRMRQPFAALAKAGKALAETGCNMLNWAEVQRLKPDTLVVQNAISDGYLNQLRMYREFNSETFIIFLLDDLLDDLPEKSSQYRKIKASFRDARSRLKRALSYCDRLIVSTQPLYDLCQDMIDDIQIIPNRLKFDCWAGLNSIRGISDKPRIGWAGAQQHQGDLEMIYDVVKELADDVDWVFFGMCPDEVKPYIKEEHQFVSFDAYPAKLASLNLDLAIAPLEMHAFNEAKSNLRLLEYGVMGWPVVCTDIYPYQTNNAPVIRVPNNKADWVTAIRQLLADPVRLRQQGDRLKQWVEQHYLLENHLDEWLNALSPSK